MPLPSRKSLAAVVVASVLVAAVAYWASRNYTAPFLEPDLPYWLQFGRGSGMHGLNTVKLADDGTVTLHRMGPEPGQWETGTLRLPPEALDKVRASINRHRLLQLEKHYHANVVDGTQWVLLIKQADKQSSVYFDNVFPDEIVAFAADLDRILEENGEPQIHWRRVLWNDGRHQRELWDSIR